MQLIYILGTDFAKLLDQQQQIINILSTPMQYNMQRTPNNYICHLSSSSQQYDTFQNETDQQQIMSQHSPSFNPQENLPLPQSATSQAIYYYYTYVVIVFSIPCIQGISRQVLDTCFLLPVPHMMVLLVYCPVLYSQFAT